MPSLVGKAGLERANGRMQAADQLVQNFIATPIGGLLFAVAIAVPVLVTGAGFLVAAVLALTLPVAAGRALAEPDTAVVSTSARADFREAFTYLFGHRLLRNLVLVTGGIGSMLTLAQAAAVLFFLDTLSVPAAFIGFVTAGVGLGGLTGALLASTLVARFGRGKVMLAALLVASLALLATGLSPNVWLATAAYAVGAGAVTVWNVPWGALRQDIVPGRLLGRVTGLNRSLVWGSFVLSGLLGGLLARIDLCLPFLVGGIASLIVTALAIKLVLSVDARHAAETERRAEQEITG